jgi:hypothetical protein
MLTIPLRNELTELFAREKGRQIYIKLDGNKIRVQAIGFSGLGNDALRYIQSNYSKWKTSAQKKIFKQTRKRVNLTPLAIDFRLTNLEIYFKVSPPVPSDAVYIIVNHKTENMTSLYPINLKDIRS